MPKRKTPAKPPSTKVNSARPRNPTDSTLRNVKAAKTRTTDLTARVQHLDQRLKAVERALREQRAIEARDTSDTDVTEEESATAADDGLGALAED